MKAIGKASLATLLAAGLHIVRIALIAGFAGLAVAAVVMPLLPLLAPVAARIDGVVVDGFDMEAGDYVKVMRHFVSFGVMLFIVNRLLAILRTLRIGSPFAPENADRFAEVGYAILIGEAAKIMFAILGAAFKAEAKLNVEPLSLVGAVAVFVLAEVFRQGARMKEEQDLTV
jgi:hypothetical protein